MPHDHCACYATSTKRQIQKATFTKTAKGPQHHPKEQKFVYVQTEMKEDEEEKKMKKVKKRMKKKKF